MLVPTWMGTNMAAGNQPKNSQWTLTFTSSSNGHLKLMRELVNMARVLDQGASVSERFRLQSF